MFKRFFAATFVIIASGQGAMSFVRARASLVPAALVLAAATVPMTAAHATQTYDFSYTFDTGDVISGSLVGTASGDVITNLSHISSSFDGTPLIGSGNLYAYSYTNVGSSPNCGTCFELGEAVASSDPLKNNFVISDSSTFFNSGSWNNYFYIIPWFNAGPTNPVVGTGSTVEADQYDTLNEGGVDGYNGNYIPSNWHISAVPLPAALPLLGTAIAGLAGLSLRRSRKGPSL